MSIRISDADLQKIHHKAQQAGLSITDYVTRCCLGKQIVVIEGLDEVIRQQKAIGRNLNQLTILANMGRIHCLSIRSAGPVRPGQPAAVRHFDAEEIAYGLCEIHCYTGSIRRWDAWLHGVLQAGAKDLGRRNPATFGDRSELHGRYGLPRVHEYQAALR